jgi:hypothetical protein
VDRGQARDSVTSIKVKALVTSLYLNLIVNICCNSTKCVAEVRINRIGYSIH